MLPSLLAAALGYLLGSIPTAYLLVKWKSDIDIRSAGSGNVGTLNSLQVSKSKLVGAGVLVGDLLKGVAAVLAARALLGGEFLVLASAGCGAVLGHNFPVWLRFKGGRGLATGAGVLLVIGWKFVVIWVLCWGAGKLFLKNVNLANILASVLMLLCALLIPAAPLFAMIPADASAEQFRVFALMIIGIILVRHVEPLREYLKSKRTGVKTE